MKSSNHKGFKCPRCKGEFEDLSVFRLHLARRYNIFIGTLSAEKVMKYVKTLSMPKA